MPPLQHCERKSLSSWRALKLTTRRRYPWYLSQFQHEIFGLNVVCFFQLCYMSFGPSSDSHQIEFNFGWILLKNVRSMCDGSVMWFMGVWFFIGDSNVQDGQHTVEAVDSSHQQALEAVAQWCLEGALTRPKYWKFNQSVVTNLGSIFLSEQFILQCRAKGSFI
jgi:hypothetical protein